MSTHSLISCKLQRNVRPSKIGSGIISKSFSL